MVENVSSSIKINTIIFFTHIVGYRYFCPMGNLVFSVWIMVQMHQILFLMTQIQCILYHRIEKKALTTK